ncbi:ABC transporter ATP-binding protein [Trinickia violacea]|uniref:ABC transporter ATP-binding protein n=1 Tax=Trinickia violacea TaxID=2571746 RepID=A0A4P8IWY8_9BURK|nr:ABC transporter ATP-binding protein [Trinickia violacea]QCP52976.1 ABC transporter ATP-binding protein [Trinickia violacea]
MSKLALRGIEKRFGQVLAVDGLELVLEEGEFVSLLGPSGCGKTTTLRMIAGFIDPSAGTIEMDGKLLSSPAGAVPPERRQMSMIFQSYAVWPNMTVEQNVAFGLKLRRLSGEEMRRRVGEMLDVVHMSHLAQRYPADLSGGQQQRVALARAVVIRPSVLLLDEPLSNLDANLREEMRFEIRRLHDEFRITTVYVTHDQAEAMVTSDRIAVMNQGRIEQVDSPHTLYTRPRTRFVAGFVGRTNLIDGACNGAEIVFDRFSVPRSALPDGGALAGKVTFSVRPQSMRLSRSKSQRVDHVPQVEVRVLERAYLGEYWDYAVVPVASSTRLRVSASPLDVYNVGEVLWLELDPSQMAAIV